MKLVLFSDGTYGVMVRRWPWPTFASIFDGEFAWSSRKHIWKYCRGTEKEAREAMKKRARGFPRLTFTVIE